MTLNSTSPFAAPLIDPAFMKERSDVAILREAVKAAHRFVSAPVWQSLIVAPFASAVPTTTDAEIERYITNEANTFRHPMGTARIARASENTGVVGPDLLVKHVQGLRIVDASVFVSSFIALVQSRPELTLCIASYFWCSSASTSVRDC